MRKGHATLVGLVGAGCLAIAMASATAADPGEVDRLFNEGRAAFYRGDHAGARLLLLRVQAVNPRHVPTRALLEQIRIREEADPGRSLRESLEATILPKIEVRNADLKSVVELITSLVSENTGGKIEPSFVLMGFGKDEHPDITLQLANVPGTTVIDYVADFANATVRYDRHAVVLTARGSSTGDQP